MLKKISIGVAGAALMSVGVGESVQAAFSFEVIASGLESPRGLTIGPDDALYVAEAGRGGEGPCINTPTVDDPSAENCYGRTSGVTRIQNGIAKRVFTGLPSLARSVDGDVGDATGASDIAFDAGGRAYVVLGFVSGSQSDRDQKLGISDFGHLIALSDLNGANSWTLLADLSAFETANNSDGGNTDNGENPLDSNPYDLVIQDDTAFVIDSAANALVGVGLEDGEIALQSVFSPRLVNNPFPGPSSLLMHSVPTSITVGPDGAFYVGELTGFPYPKGEARIYRVTSGNESQVYIEGFTNIIDVAFDTKGNLYVLEYTTNSLLSGDSTGALIRVSPDGTRTTIDSDQLIFPTALVIGSDNTIYVANKGFSTGGEIIRIQSKNEPISVPEPSSFFSLLALGGISLGWQYDSDKPTV
jgi:hypothetical protein